MQARYKRRAADLAKAAALLGTRYRDWAPTPPDVRHGFIAAYQAAHPQPVEDLDEVHRRVAELVSGWRS